MEIKEILNCFSDPKEGLPREAVDAALNQQEAITPHLLSILEHTISNYESIDPYKIDYFFLRFICFLNFEKRRHYPLFFQ